MQTNPNTKRILCYGDSNTRGRVPLGMGMKRYSLQERRPGILQTLLGEGYEIIEEGLGGRTTMFDDPRTEFPERNGLKTLPIILESHLPLDYVIVMLGTTDTKEMMNTSSQETTEGMRQIIQTIKGYKVLEGTTKPQIMLIVPPIVQETADFASKLFLGGTAKATALKKSYAQLAEEEGTVFLDPTDTIKVDEHDGVHIDATNHKKLATFVSDIIKKTGKK